MCHTRTVLPPGGAAGRQFSYVVVLMAVFMRGQKQTECICYLWVWHVRKGCNTIKKGIPFVRAHDAGCCVNPGVCAKVSVGYYSVWPLAKG